MPPMSDETIRSVVPNPEPLPGDFDMGGDENDRLLDNDDIIN